MSRRRYPTSDPANDMALALESITKRIASLEGGRHRGPASSFGSPLLVTNADSSVTWALAVDDNGNLVAYTWGGEDAPDGPPTVIASL